MLVTISIIIIKLQISEIKSDKSVYDVNTFPNVDVRQIIHRLAFVKLTKFRIKLPKSKSIYLRPMNDLRTTTGILNETTVFSF